MKTKPEKKKSQAKSAKIVGKLVRIGNSRGIRLPKSLIEQAGLIENVEISVRGSEIVIRPSAEKDPRAGWEEAIKRSIEKYGPLEPLESEWEYMKNDFDEKEWQW